MRGKPMDLLQTQLCAMMTTVLMQGVLMYLFGVSAERAKETAASQNRADKEAAHADAARAAKAV